MPVGRLYGHRAREDVAICRDLFDTGAHRSKTDYTKGEDLGCYRKSSHCGNKRRRRVSGQRPHRGTETKNRKALRGKPAGSIRHSGMCSATSLKCWT